MGFARFIAKDPHTPTATKQELEELIPKIRGVIDWTAHPDGDVTIEYDRHLISDKLIEEALAGMGFQLHHIFDKPKADDAEVQAALEKGESE
jgi:hypothetical protein